MGFWDNFTNLVEPVRPKPKPKQTDPMDFLAELGLSGPPSSQELYNDALNQVGGSYQAALGNIDSEEAQARSRQKQGDAQLAAMYAALQRDIGKNRGVISKDYGDSISASKGQTAATTGAISNTYKQTNNELAQLFSQLGIEAAAPDALMGSNQDRGFLSGIANINGQSDVNRLGRDRAASLSFNTAQQNIAGLSGKEKRSALMTQLNDALTGFGQQRNSIHGQMADAINSRQYQLEQDAMNRQNQLSELMLRMQESQGQAQGMSASQQYAQMGPVERGYSKASTLFGPDTAGYAMQLINGVANNQNGGVYQNIGHFIRSVLAENQKQQQAGQPALDPDELQALASYFWDEGGTGRKDISPY